MKLNKDYQAMLAPFLAAGFTVKPTAGKHLAVYDPRGRRASVLPGTPGDARSLLNARAELRRAKRALDDYRQCL